MTSFDFNDALLQGEDEPRINDVESLMVARTNAFLKLAPTVPDTPAAEESAGQGERFHLKTSADLVNSPPMRWTLKGLLPRRGVGQVYGASMAAKTFLLLDMVTAITDGAEDWYGFRVKSAPVVYIVLEGEEGFKNRIRAAEKYRGKPLSDKLLFVIDEGFRLYGDDGNDVKALAEVCPVGALVIIDTQNAAAPFVDENSARDMGGLIEGAKELARRIDGFVLLVAHTGKDASRGSRGSSVQMPSWDCCLEVSRKENSDVRTWKPVKVKDGRDDGVFHFRLEIVELGQDEDGDDVTSCVALREEGNAGQEEKKEKGLPSGARVGLRTLKEALEEAEDAALGIDVETWRKAYYKRHTGDTAAAKSIAFKRAREVLTERGFVSVADDMYTLTPKGRGHDFNP